VRKEREADIRGTYVLGPPDAAIEIVSPDSIERDYVTKRNQYEAARVKEYWIVDPLKQKVTLLRLDNTGKFREVRSVKGRLRSRVIEGFWLEIAWLWQQPLPDEIETIFRIMEGA